MTNVQLSVDEISDELYNELLMAFVTRAIEMGIDVPRGSTMENWVLKAELVRPGRQHVH